MRAARAAVGVVTLLLFCGCGPAVPPGPPAPPPTRKSIYAEARDKMKRAVTYVEEMEEIRGAKEPPPELPPLVEDDPPAKKRRGRKGRRAKATPPPVPKAPLPKGMTEEAASELDRLISRSKDLKGELVAMREELASMLEEMKDPLKGRDLSRARGVIARMGDKVGEIRDMRTRAEELKPQPPEPKKEEKKPGPATK